LVPVAVIVVRGFIPDGLRSSLKTYRHDPRNIKDWLRTAAQPIGDESPRHRFLSAFLARQLQIIQRPIHRQLPKHDQLRDAQQRSSLRGGYEVGEVVGDGSG
jgi:hypothetical protein